MRTKEKELGKLIASIKNDEDVSALWVEVDNLRQQLSWEKESGSAERVRLLAAYDKLRDDLVFQQIQTRLARVTARVLAHAYVHDSRPPDADLERARRWDARGNQMETK